MKKEFETANGSKGMIIDCGIYEVKFYKGVSSIFYTNKKAQKECMLPATFNIDWDEDREGGRLEIKYKGRFGGEMIFIHYDPEDLKGMFDFIAAGYRVDEWRDK